MSILDTRKKILLLIAMMGAYAIIFIDESGIAVTLPMMQQALGLTNNAVHWIINSYLLTLSVLLLLGGKLSDIYGNKRIFTLGILIFILASLICGGAQNSWMMLGGRFLQGIGASLLMPCIMVLIHRGFPDNEFGKAFGLVLTVSNFFYAMGPFIGGVLTEFLNWRYFFWVNIPIGLVCLYFTLSAIEKDIRTKIKKFDTAGLISFILSFSALIIAIMQGAVWGWSNYWIIGLFIIAVLGLCLFVKIELAAEEPLLEIRLFQKKDFLAGNIILFCSCVCLTSIVFWALWLQISIGFSPATVGLALLPATLTFIFIPTLGGAWRDKSGSRAPLLTGTFLLLFSLCWIVATINLQNYFWIVLGLVAFGFALPLAIPNSSIVVMTAVEPEQTGMASGALSTVRQFALTLGIAILSAITSSYYNFHLAQFLNSSTDYKNIPREQVNLLLAGNTKISQLTSDKLLLLTQTAKSINTRALFYAMIVIIIFAAIGCAFTYIFIKKSSIIHKSTRR